MLHLGDFGEGRGWRRPKLRKGEAGGVEVAEDQIGGERIGTQEGKGEDYRTGRQGAKNNFYRNTRRPEEGKIGKNTLKLVIGGRKTWGKRDGHHKKLNNIALPLLLQGLWANGEESKGKRT